MMTREAARGLTQHGVRPGDVVTLIGETGPELIAAFFGALAVGATPSPAAPPMIFKELDRYREHLARVLDATRPAVVVAGEGLAGAIEIIGGRSAAVVELPALFGQGGELTPWSARAGEIALLQLTSGSTGAARAVSIPHSALTANAGALSRWLGIAPGSSWASWLPLHHDMGLVGGMIAPVVYEADLWLMRPEQFVRDPLGYLRCFGMFGARLSATPPFALDLIARRVPADALEGMDFSSVEGIVVGAERIAPGTLERFHALLGPFGLRREALLPAYGLAEATLAVSGLPRGRGWQSTVVDSASLALGRRIRPPEQGEKAPRWSDADGRSTACPCRSWTTTSLRSAREGWGRSWCEASPSPAVWRVTLRPRSPGWPTGSCALEMPASSWGDSSSSSAGWATASRCAGRWCSAKTWKQPSWR
jgi:acyl-CoA synthetase (AMP-forming)/AMP-acid ligase II